MKTNNVLNILLIEDDDSHAKIITRYLKKLEDSPFLTHARNLDKGLKALTVVSYHIILLDLRLPDSHFNETLSKTLAQAGHIPIIVLSSLEDKLITRKMIQEGAQDYLCKSELSSELLIRTIYSSIERKNSDLALHESEVRKAKVIDSSLDCIISIDNLGKIIEFNHSAEFTFGYKRDEALGKDMTDLLISKENQDSYQNDLKKFFKTGDSYLIGKRIEMIAIRKDKKLFPIEISIVSIQLSNQKIFTSFIRDITEQKKVAQDLKTAKEAAESANLAKSAFLANMSHEIRTPLGALLGFSELLLDDQVSQNEKIGYAAAVKHNGELLSKIINDILDLSKVEAGKMETEIKSVNLNEILSDTKSLLILRAKNKGITLDFSIEKNVPNYIFTDPIRLKQILLNLVGNSIKFTDKGFVRIKVELQNASISNRKIAFIVTDSGRGIDKEQTSKLFAAFSQIDNSTKRNFGGSGLGLFLSKRLSNLLGGNVQLIKSEPNVGSTFELTIDPGPYTLNQPQNSVTQSKTALANINYRLDGVKILLVDDSSDNRLLVSKFLMITGAEVDIVNNGKEAIEKATESKYDVLLMDLQMPVMDGYEATAHLRNQGYKVPIVALTAHAMIEEKNRCLANGFNEHISKPVDRSLLIEKIYNLSTKNRAPKGDTAEPM